MKNTWLKFLVAISAIMIAGSAAYFSVTGLGVLFSGAAVAVMVMAGSLEFAKLVTATYLKQEWENVSIVNKWYLTSAVVILMAITSAGIFGYLSNAFQQQNIKLDQVQREIDVWNNKIKTDTTQITLYTNQLNQLQSNNNTVLNNNTNRSSLRFATSTSKEQSKIRTKISVLNDSVVAYNGHINDIKNNNIDLEREVGGFRFVAEAFNVELKSVVKFFIILIVVVFDPLAVALVISFNQLMIGSRKKDEEEVKPTADPEDLKNFVDETVRLRLSDEELKILEDALLNPPPPNDALKEAVQKYNEEIISQSEYNRRRDLLAEIMKNDQELGLYDEPYDNPLVKEKNEEASIKEKVDAVLDEANVNIDEFEKAIKEELNSVAPFGERFDIELVDTPNEVEIEPTITDVTFTITDEVIEQFNQLNQLNQEEAIPALSDEEVREMVMDEWERDFDFDEDVVDGGEFENNMPPVQTDEEMVELDKEIIEDETVSFVDDTYMQHEIVEEFDGFVPEPFATPEEVERFSIDIKIIDNSPEFDFNIQQVTPTPEFDIEVKVVEPENEDDEKKNF